MENGIKMNERIRQLEDACWEELGEDECYYPVFNKEKFAELIVRECAEQIRLQGTDWIDWQPSQQGIRPEYVAMAEHIKQHFGVEG
jgi:hypothetical protein